MLVLRIFSSLALLAGAIGCRTAPSEQTTASERKAPPVIPSPTSAPPLTTAAPASKGEVAAHCLSPAEVEGYDPFGWQLKGPRRVVQVARDDTLALRESPSPSAPLVAGLSFDRSDIVPTKSVCFVGDTPWIEVRAAEKLGWVNSRFLALATSAHDVAEQYRLRAGQRSHATPRQLAEAIVHAMNTPPPTEGKYHARVIDVVVSGAEASAIIYAFGELDDSVAGEQALVTMVKAANGWSVEHAAAHSLCYRGTTEDGAKCI